MRFGRGGWETGMPRTQVPPPPADPYPYDSLPVRNHLAAVRKRILMHRIDEPLFLSDEVSPDVTFADFCIFVTFLRRRNAPGTEPLSDPQ